MKMDNKDTLTEKIGEIDPKYLEECFDRRDRRQRRRKNVRRIGGIAAAVVLVTAVSLAALSPVFRSDRSDLPSDTVSTQHIAASSEEGHETDSNGPDAETDPANDNIERDITVIYPTYIDPQYFAHEYAFPTDQFTLFSEADAVIVGKYVSRYIETNEMYVTGEGQIISRRKVMVKDILKSNGEIKDSEIEIEYYGGAVSVSEFVRQVGKESEIVKKYGFDSLTEEEADRSYVGIESGLGTQWNSDYLMFLSYDESTGVYFVLCDGYGMRQLNENGEAFNIDTGEYEEIVVRSK